MERDLDQEHLAIVQAALDRDADKAVRLMTEHLQKTASIIFEATVTAVPPGPSPAQPKLSPKTEGDRLPISV